MAQSDKPSTYPDRPVKLVVPYGPGSSTDLMVRIYAQKLSTLLGQAVIVDNKAGAGTMIGTSFVAHAPADGYTLLVGTNALSIMPSLYRTDFDTTKDFVPVAPLYNTSLILMAKPNFPANNVTEFVALAKKQPGKYSYSTWGIGGSGHLVMELLKDKADIELLHVPYKGGGAEAAQAIVTGDVDVGLDVAYTAMPRIKSGTLKALGVFYPERVESLPEVQTVGEAGYPEAVLYGWVGIFAPSKTPPEIVFKVTSASQEVLKDPAFIQKLRDLGSKPFLGSPEILRQTVVTETRNVKQIVEKRKIKVE